jgi:hypothetical protein
VENKGMSKGKLQLIASVCVLAIVIAIGVALYSAGVYSNSSPAPTPVATPPPTINPTIAITPTPTNKPITTPNSGHTITYSELSKNETMIIIQFKLEPSSYIFQLNATSVYLTQGGTRISANTNEAVIIGTQYATLFFPVNDYNGTDYHLSSNELPSGAVWIRQ